jgi:hypothetical protein
MWAEFITLRTWFNGGLLSTWQSTFELHKKEGNSLTSSATISFSRRILRHGVHTIYIISIYVKVCCAELCVIVERSRFKLVDLFRNSLM